RFERILKVQKAITAGLGPKEREDILRVSVLTADEYKRLHPALQPSRSVPARVRRQSANGKPIRLGIRKRRKKAKDDEAALADGGGQEELALPFIGHPGRKSLKLENIEALRKVEVRRIGNPD